MTDRAHEIVAARIADKPPGSGWEYDAWVRDAERYAFWERYLWTVWNHEDAKVMA